MTIGFTDAALADIEYAPAEQTHCSCHSIREGSGGQSYSCAILGVSCPECESLDAERDFIDWWNALTHDERIAELTRIHTARTALAATELADTPF